MGSFILLHIVSAKACSEKKSNGVILSRRENKGTCVDVF